MEKPITVNQSMCAKIIAMITNVLESNKKCQPNHKEFFHLNAFVLIALLKKRYLVQNSNKTEYRFFLVITVKRVY